ncbi:hypothetical protein [Butyrivibrio sp. FC2001]|uniref:hypothetical protein n=1 Tax=Butyrivibrio sp. FC2001 TaxID=1280671 RepID=UPI000478B981|nr:hypothetical protein [Butyrivibrio sp. FC2001]
MSVLLALIWLLAFISTIALFVISMVLRKQNKDYKSVRRMSFIAYLISCASFIAAGLLDSRNISDVLILSWMFAFVAAVALSIIALGEKHRKEDHRRTRNLAFIAYSVFFVCFIASIALMWNNPSKASGPAVEGENDTVEVAAENEVVEEVEAKEDKETEVEDTKVDEVLEEEAEKTGDVIENDEALTIFLVAEEPNEYSKELVLNEGRGEDEYRMLGYFIPAGKYEFTNLGDYPTQINIYKNEKHTTEEGWEEWSDGEVQRIKVDETIEMTVKEGYFVKLIKPDYIRATKID